MSGLWVSIDGVEGAGKTTLCRALAGSLGVDVCPEFSSASIGRALESAVRVNPHYISRSNIGQSLFFIGDFYETYESNVKPAIDMGRTVLSDRGFLSKYSYQVAALEGELGLDHAKRYVRHLLSECVPPHLTVYLSAPFEVLRVRLLERDGSCEQSRLDFMARAQDIAVRELTEFPGMKSLVFENETDVYSVVAAVKFALIEMQARQPR